MNKTRLLKVFKENVIVASVIALTLIFMVAIIFACVAVVTYFGPIIGVVLSAVLIVLVVSASMTMISFNEWRD